MISTLALISACHNPDAGSNAERPHDMQWVPERFSSGGDRGGGEEDVVGDGDEDTTSPDGQTEEPMRPRLQLEQQGVINASVSGVVIEERRGDTGRAQGHAGMDGMVCEFDRNGDLGLDTYTPGSERPKVHDAEDNLVLASTSSELMLLWGGMVQASATLSGIRQAALTDYSAIAVADCQLIWFGDGEGYEARVIELDGPTCLGARMTYDRQADVAYVAAGGAVHAIDREGQRSLGGAAQDVVLNAQSQTLLLVEPGAERVTGMRVDGEPLWTARVPGASEGEQVYSVADLGDELGFALTTSGPYPTLYIIDALTGQAMGQWSLSEAAPVYGGPDGRTLGLVRAHRTVLFSLN
ncbi:MAG: hypothetical protein EA397_18045 [Deltaproteobacteria bacterium]|nr:MAG: hypothetical protein EA397_18045 [Deltaproteobacteria bacterium]